MGTSPVFGLGYVRVWRADRLQWRQFAEQVVGMMAVEDGEQRQLLRMDEWVARFVVESGAPPLPDGAGPLAPDVAIGWECKSDAAWVAARRAIDGAGIYTEDGTGPTPWCRDWFAFTDLSGFRCELLYGGKRDPATQYVSPRGVTFVTGDQGMGHVTSRATAPSPWSCTRKCSGSRCSTRSAGPWTGASTVWPR